MTEERMNFSVPAAVGVAGGLLERIGVKGANAYIGGVASNLIGKGSGYIANALASSGQEGITEWLQFGLETYNTERAKGNEEASGDALKNLFTREGAEMALQGAVGALVGGQTGRAGRKLIGQNLSNDFDATPGDGNLKAVVNSIRGKEVDNSNYEGNWLFERSKQLGAKLKGNEYKPKIERDFLGNVITPEQIIEEEEAREEAKQSGIDFYETELGGRKRQEAAQKAAQTKAYNARVQELKDEYDGTVETPTADGELAYVLKGLGDEGITTLDQALGILKTDRNKALGIVTKAGIGIRTPQEQTRLEGLVSALKEANDNLPGVTDPVAQKGTQDFINDTNQKIADEFNTQNKKILLADPQSVVKAIEASNEIKNLSDQEAAITNNTELPAATKEQIISNIQDKKALAYEKGEIANTQINKSYQDNVAETNTQAAEYEALLDEEVADNSQKIGDLLVSGVDLGFYEDPKGDKVVDDTLSDQRQALTDDTGSKEYGKRLGGYFPTYQEAIAATTKWGNDISAKGFKYDVEYIDSNPARPGGETQVNVEFYAPLEQSRADQLKAQEAAQEQEQVEEGEVIEEGVVEEAPVEGVQEEERTPLSYVSDFAPEAQETALPGGEIFLPGEDAKSAGAYRAVGGLKKRGHAEAKFDKIGGGFLVTPGPRQEGEQIEYSLAEEATPKNQSGEVSRVKTLPVESEDGATFNLDGSVFENGGLVVPIASRNIPQNLLTDEAIENFKQKYKDYMGPASKIGIYKFPGQDLVSIDLNVIAPQDKKQDALIIAKRLGQESLFDLDTFENIKTGESGQRPKTVTAAQARNISERLSRTVDEDRAAAKKADRLRKQEEIQAPKYKSTPLEKFEEVARHRAPEIRTEGVRGPVPTYEGGVIQETERAPQGEELDRLDDRGAGEGITRTLANEKGKITDAVIDLWKGGDTAHAIVKSIPYVRALAKNNQKNRDAALDPEIESVALEAATQAFTNGEYLGRQFDPENAADAHKLLGGIVKDAVRDYYLGEGAPAGIRKLSKDATTRLNKINAASRRLGTTDPVAIAEALNKGFSAIQEKKLKGRIVPGKREADVYRSPEQLGKEVGPSRARTRFVQDEKITPQQVNDLLAKQEGLTPERIDATPFDVIAPEVSKGLESGGSVADVLGVNLEGLPKSNREMLKYLNSKDIENKMDDIIKAVTPDRDAQQDIKKYVNRHIMGQVEKARKLKDFAAKLLSAERDNLGKQKTPSQEYDF